MKRDLNKASAGFLNISYDTKFARNLLRDIQITDCKKDHISEGSQCTKSAGSVFDDFDDPIESFSYCIGQAASDEGEDFCAVFSDSIDNFSHRFKATPKR